MLQEEWMQNKEAESDVLTYITNIRNRMEEAREFVEENARRAQAKQKEYYDQKARELNLKPGDKVLLLLPSRTKKFVTQWQGPYKITRCTGKVNFEVSIPDKGGGNRSFILIC